MIVADDIFLVIAKFIACSEILVHDLWKLNSLDYAAYLHATQPRVQTTVVLLPKSTEELISFSTDTAASQLNCTEQSADEVQQQ